MTAKGGFLYTNRGCLKLTPQIITILSETISSNQDCQSYNAEVFPDFV